MRKIKSILSGIILLVTFILVIMLVFTRINGETPELFGYQILRVSSSSMVPKLEVGDIVLSQRVDDVTTLKIGDIITFKGEYGSYTGKSITHEIIVEPFKSDGTYYLQTKGIANDYPDPEICEDQIIGKMIMTIPIFRVVYNIFMTPLGLILVLGFLAILFINEVFALRHIVKENDEDEIKIEYSSSQRGTEKEADNN